MTRDKEKERSRHALYRATHREQLAIKNAAYYAAHAEKLLAERAADRAANPAKYKARDRVRRQAHPERAAKIHADYCATHPEIIRGIDARRRARKKNAPINDFTATQWQEMQAIYDHRCVYCQKRCKGKLTQDHITPLSQGGSHTLANIVPACRPCNSRKNAGPVLKPVQPLLL